MVWMFVDIFWFSMCAASIVQLLALNLVEQRACWLSVFCFLFASNFFVSVIFFKCSWIASCICCNISHVCSIRFYALISHQCVWVCEHNREECDYQNQILFRTKWWKTVQVCVCVCAVCNVTSHKCWLWSLLDMCNSLFIVIFYGKIFKLCFWIVV